MTNRMSANKVKYVTLGLLCLTWLINYFDKVAINVAIIPLSKQFGLSTAHAGLILSSFFLSYAIMQPIGGYLSDKLGSRKVILFSAVLWSLFTLLTGFAWSFASLIAIRFLFGIGEGSYPSASSVAVAESFPQKQRARAKSILTSSTTLGAMIGSLVAATLTSWFGWKYMFVALGAVGFAVCFVLFFFLKPGGQTDPKPAGEAKAKMPLKQLVSMPFVWQLTLIYFGASIVTWGMQSWMPSYLVKVHHLDLVSMGALSSIPSLVGFISVLITGWLLDKKFALGREKYFVIVGSVVTAICIYLMFQAPSVGMVVFYQCLSSLGGVLIVTTVLTMPLKYLDQQVIGSASGFVYLGGQVAGIIAPSLMGFMIQSFNGSYQAAFWVMIAAMVFPFFAALTLRRGFEARIFERTNTHTGEEPA
ncbi:hypothetical protein SD70_08195 [Gordoniibacillus kamchatkensis]|uniref:Major facilitator superfamily (MFS) profile domain-containing protein n=1 Tax=Gordoniibacillus kamchatkensis TaxID=1590651 RepID=A0ABR5ALQ8_9BACL|nr:MFS transporter [Paenibacillus sp. VKM B-2647]KIL41292.1 hypothetical protein SD70_08195 [Paenibacillus sp. VKM B-2647]